MILTYIFEFGLGLVVAAGFSAGGPTEV